MGRLAEWLCSGLQIRVPRFDSGGGLHSSGFLIFLSELWFINETKPQKRGLNSLGIMGPPTIRFCTGSPHQLSYFTFR